MTLEGTNTWSAYTYPRKHGRATQIPVYSNDGLSRNYGGTNPYPEASYGFMRFRAEVGRVNLVGFDRLNPQLQEKVIPMKGGRGRWKYSKPRKHSKGRATTARIRSARAYTK